MFHKNRTAEERNLAILVESHDGRREKYVHLLRNLGWEVEVFSDGASALDAFKEMPAEKLKRAIIITDVDLEAKDIGFDLPKAISQTIPNVPLMVLADMEFAPMTQSEVRIAKEKSGAHHAATGPVNKKGETKYHPELHHVLPESFEPALKQLLASFNNLSDQRPKSPLDHADKSKSGSGLPDR